nr:glycosyltransferase family A protein [Methylorubrum zatmanii]
MSPLEIIIVDDGSTDDTRAVANRARQDLVDMVICHGTRCGRSAAINAAARFASGDLLSQSMPILLSATRSHGLLMRSTIRAWPAPAATSRFATRARRYGPGCRASNI